MSNSQKINNQILDAFGIVIDSQLRKLKFDKTVQASIVQLIDESTGSYKVRYQDSIFTAYSIDPKTTYKQGDAVYVSVHMNNVQQNSTIIGTVSKLGANYITETNEQSKYNILGSNLLIKQDEVYALNSYTGSSIKILKENAIDQVLTDTYKDQADALQIVANIRTALPYSHQTAGGDYGIKVKCSYYDPRYPEHSSQHLIYRQYTFNTTNMTGQPYKYDTASRQQMIFGQIDGENLYKIEDITGFSSKFEQGSATGEDDIFLSNIQLNLLKQLSEEQINGASLTIETLNASYFDEATDTIELKAIPKIKGKVVNLKQNTVAFYWFMKDNSVTNTSINYQQYGGFGWRCLNSYSENAGVRSFNRGKEYCSLTKADCPAFDTKIKCVAVFEDGDFTTAENIIDIFNNVSAQQRVTLTSSNGVKFNFNRGTTTLQAAPANSTYTYYWSASRDGNPYEEVAGVHGSEYTPDDLTSFLNNISYSVTIYNGAIYVGSADITLINGQGEGDYQLILHNGDQIFHYNSQGVGPTNPAADIRDKITISPLSFDIIDPQGRIITFTDDIQKINQCKIKWVLPQELSLTLKDDTWAGRADLTMLTFDENKYSITSDIVDNKTRYYIPNTATLEYSIIDTYDAGRTINNIQLEVEFDGHRLNAQTRFTFIKDGNSGTNGTKYTTRILPYNTDFDDLYLMVHKQTNNSLSSKIVGIDVDGNIASRNTDQLKVQVYDGTPNPVLDEYSNKNLTWSLLKHLNDQDVHNLSITKDGRLSPNLGTDGFNECADIVQAIVSDEAINNGQLTCYGSYSIISEYIKDVAAPAGFNGFIVHQGYREVVYNTDGTRGAYSTTPFVLTSTIDTIDKSQIIWYTSWQKSRNNQYSSGDSYFPIPPNVFNYGETNQYVVAVLVKNTNIQNVLTEDNIIAKVVIPIHFHLNQYGLHAMNDWDGNSIRIKDDHYILAPQMGAGTKNSDNTFTGVTFGKTFNSTTKSDENGLFAYNHGERTVFINAKDGSSYFGISGKGQIQLLPNEDAIIQSGNYDEDAKNGLQINLTKPYIKYGSGNFYVDENGFLTAKSADIGGNINAETLSTGGRTSAAPGAGNGIYIDKDGNLVSGNNNEITIKGNGYTYFGTGDAHDDQGDSGYFELDPIHHKLRLKMSGDDLSIGGKSYNQIAQDWTEELKKQTDGFITTYCQTDNPIKTVGKDKLNEGDLWIDTTLKDNHNQNILKRWTKKGDGTLDWVVVQDDGIRQAAAAATAAQNSANRKVHTFYKSEPAPTAADIPNNKDGVQSLNEGDLWIDTTPIDGKSSNKLKRYTKINGVLSWQDVSDNSYVNYVDTEIAKQTSNFITTYTVKPPTTDDLHDGDLFIDKTNNNQIQRYNATTKKWQDVRDTGITQAIQDAATAQATADGKVKTYAQTEEPKDASEGDLWIETDNDNLLHRYTNGSWKSYRDAYIDDAVKAATDTWSKELQSQTDGKITTFFQSKTPDNASLGDLWMDSSNNNNLKRYNGTSWDLVVDAGIQKAAAAAKTAQDTADTKIITYAQTGQPKDASEGDLWIDTDNKNSLHRYTNGSWELYRDALINENLKSANEHTDEAVKNATDVWLKQLNTKTEGLITTYVSPKPTDTSKLVVGDLYIATDKDNQLYRWDGKDWQPMQDNGIKNALTQSAGAIALADGKIRTFTKADVPPTDADVPGHAEHPNDDAYNLQVGDLWIDIGLINGDYTLNDTATAQGQVVKNASGYKWNAPTPPYTVSGTRMTASGTTSIAVSNSSRKNTLYRYDGTNWVSLENNKLRYDLQNEIEEERQERIQFNEHVNNLLGLKTTEITERSVISPYIGGGYLYITRHGSNASVLIDPNNEQNEGFIFRVNNAEKKTVFGLDQQGNIYLEGQIRWDQVLQGNQTVSAIADAKVTAERNDRYEFENELKQTLGMGSTVIDKKYVISPYIGGGYLKLSGNNYTVTIDPNLTDGIGNTNTIFGISNADGKTLLGVDKDGTVHMTGQITWDQVLQANNKVSDIVNPLIETEKTNRQKFEKELTQGLGSTVIDGNYIISPNIGGGYLKILAEDGKSGVTIDPAVKANDGALFKVTNSIGDTVLGVDADGTVHMTGNISWDQIANADTQLAAYGYQTADNVSTSITNSWTNNFTQDKVVATATGSASTDTKQGIFVGTDKKLHINASSITAGTMSANYISGGTIDANKISVTNLNASNITSGTMSADRISGGTITSTNYTAGQTYSSNGTKIYLTNGSFVSKNFYIDSNGNAKFKGVLTAAAGSMIGDWHIGADSIWRGSDKFNTAGTKYFGLSGLSINNTFSVDSNGVLNATGATVDGTITTSAVKIKYNNVVKDAIIPCLAQSLTTDIQDGQVFGKTDQGLLIASNYSAVKIASKGGSVYTGTLWATGQVVVNRSVIAKQLVAANLAYGSRINLTAGQNGNAGIGLSGNINYIDFKGADSNDCVVRMSQSNNYTVSFTGKGGTGVTIAAAVFSGTATNAATLTGNATAYDGTQRRPILVHESAERVVKCISSNSDGTISVWGKWGGSTLSSKSFKNSGSDRRLKKNIKNSTLNALQLINKIKHREFIKIDENNRYEAVGYIAQELEEIDPNLVIKPHSEDEYYSVDTFYLLGVVTKSIQELYQMYQKIIEEL